MRRWTLISLLSICVSSAFAVEGDAYRLLSVSTSGKFILISQAGTKTKFLLDASAAKITVDGKPAEFKNLSDYSTVHVKFVQKKSEKEGIIVDGTATEISILTPENIPGKT